LGDPGVVERLLNGRAAVVCGPGLGQADGTRALVAHVVRRTNAPLVLDADGLNLVVGTAILRERPGPTVVTPHPAEIAPLPPTSTGVVQADRVATARRVGGRHGGG